MLPHGPSLDPRPFGGVVNLWRDRFLAASICCTRIGDLQAVHVTNVGYLGTLPHCPLVYLDWLGCVTNYVAQFPLLSIPKEGVEVRDDGLKSCSTCDCQAGKSYQGTESCYI